MNAYKYIPTCSILLVSLLTACAAKTETPAVAEKPATTATTYKSHLYTESNESANQIIHFGRNADGTLTEIERVATSGKGTNGFKPATGEASAPDTLLSAGAVALSADHSMLFAVNAGDNSVSVFSVAANGALTLTDKQATGEKGVSSSLTYNDRTKTLYVLHTLGPKHIRSFKVADGKLTNTNESYTINTDKFKNRVATQIISSPDGRFVLVDVLFNAPPAPGANGPKLTPSNAGTKDGVMVFPVADNGQLGKAVVNDAGGPTPFSMAFLNGSNDTFVNTLAAGNGVVLSKLSADGTLKNSTVANVDLTAAPKGPSETCWVSLSPDNKFAYATNFGLGTITSFNLTADGVTTATNNLGAVPGDGKFKALAGIPTSGPNDSWASADGHLYQLYPNASTLVSYRMEGANLSKIDSDAVPYNSTLGLAGF